jgi:hypothetical protein
MAVTGAQIAADAERYKGHRYIFGGPSNVKTGWDCSSAVSYWLGHDLKMQIPGGSWASVTANGTEHGPVVAGYIGWSGATTIPNSQAQAGDLICYGPNTHIGIAVSRTEFISAEDPANGTGIAPMTAGPGTWITRRINLAVMAGGSAPGAVTVPGALGLLGHTATGIVIDLVITGVLMAGAVIVGSLVALGLGWLTWHYAQKAWSR